MNVLNPLSRAVVLASSLLVCCCFSAGSKDVISGAEPDRETRESPPLKVAEAKTHETVQVRGDVVSGKTFTVHLGEQSAELRYIEKKRVEEEFNYPRVVAEIELKQGETWERLIDIYCHDSYDDCGSITDDLSCPVIESNWVFAAPLLGLVAQLMETDGRVLQASTKGPDMAVHLIDEIGKQTPLSLCFARFHQLDPDHVGLALESLGDADVPEDVVDRLHKKSVAAYDAWKNDRERALALLEEIDAELVTLQVEVGDEGAPFKVRYTIAAVRANAAGAYKTPYVGKGGKLVRWTDR